jgi:hypothetical protein
MNQSIYGDNNRQAGRDYIEIAAHPQVDGPYTVACQNCGRLVSGMALSCPDCGHPVLNHIIHNEHSKSYMRKAISLKKYMLVSFMVLFVFIIAAFIFSCYDLDAGFLNLVTLIGIIGFSISSNFHSNLIAKAKSEDINIEPFWVWAIRNYFK